MSDKTIFLRSLEEVERSTERMIERLLKNPSCVDNSEKEDAYNITLEYFKRKQKKTKSEDEGSLEKAIVIKFEMMLENYTYAPRKLEAEHARKVALYVVQTNEVLLKDVPQDLKDEAFQIIFRYLEMQKDS